MLFWLSFCSTVFATDTTAPTNPTTTSPYTHDLDDGTIGQPFGNCPAGTSAAYVYGSGSTIRWGECQNTFAISYAINQALQGSGVSIDKVHYQWKYIHCFNTPGNFCSASIENRANTTTGEVTDDTYWDELVVVVEVTDSSGNVVETKTWTMDTWYQWNSSNSHSTNEVAEGTTVWQIHEDNIEIYNHIDKVGTIRTPNSVGDVRFRINGYDKGNWDGYYGPIVKDIKTWFTYRANPCNDTALYDPSCPGYATAYAAQQYDQNCAADALYDSGCPGYATAYFNQQCSLDATHDAACPGYAEAIYTQQCTANPLYDSGCTGYAAAYLAQQCGLDAHYDSSCTGYSSAITELTSNGTNVAGQGSDFVEVTKANDPTLYWILYYNQAEINAGGWKWECTGTSCTDDYGTISNISVQGSGTGTHMFLYTKNTSGNTVQPDNGKTYRFFKTSYMTTQCDSNTLFNQMCTGYAEAYATYLFNQACTANPLYDSECTGYDAAYLTLQCESNPLYDSSCTGYAAAFLTYQCEQNPLYDESCTGYADAYFNQQCDLDPLYNFQCTGYQDAYFNQQCQQNPQYDEMCPGYVSPVVETDIDDIIDDGTGTGDSVVDNIIEAPEVTIPGNIPGVEIITVPEIEVEIPDITPVEPEVIEVPVPDVTEQLELEIEMELEMEIEAEMEIDIEIPTQDTSDDTMEVEVETEESESESIEDIEVESENESTENETTEESTEEESTEEESTEEESTEDEGSDEENESEENTDESENEESEEESEEEVEEEKEEEKEEKSDKKEKKEEKKDDKKDEKSSDKEETTSNKSTKKKMTKEQKRKAKLKKMKEIIKNKLKELADVMGKAVSLEQQQALQAQITALINYVPGFKAYGEYYIPGVEFYQYEEIYKDKKIPENQRGLRNGLANEILHEKMVDMQYEGME
ncbi:MAG: hypothetical protein CMD92_08460 [Gammaproteobacteria bacterium]|nr:hypothetical protein [Gammaproteobacteria bacterium]